LSQKKGDQLDVQTLACFALLAVGQAMGDYPTAGLVFDKKSKPSISTDTFRIEAIVLQGEARVASRLGDHTHTNEPSQSIPRA
jgi:hypothetical protein